MSLKSYDEILYFRHWTKLEMNGWFTIVLWWITSSCHKPIVREILHRCALTCHMTSYVFLLRMHILIRWRLYLVSLMPNDRFFLEWFTLFKNTLLIFHSLNSFINLDFDLHFWVVVGVLDALYILEVLTWCYPDSRLKPFHFSWAIHFYFFILIIMYVWWSNGCQC